MLRTYGSAVLAAWTGSHQGVAILALAVGYVLLAVLVLRATTNARRLHGNHKKTFDAFRLRGDNHARRIAELESWNRSLQDEQDHLTVESGAHETQLKKLHNKFKAGRAVARS